MVQTMPWAWDKVAEAYWLEPAEEVRDPLARWTEAGYSRMLDLGCGLGRHALLFARAGFAVTGYDLSEIGLERLREQASAERLEVLSVLGDLRDLPFRDGAFDCVLAYRSIYHCDAQGLERSIGEVRRILAPGGELFANFISKESDYYIGGEGATDDSRVRMKVEEGGAELPHCYLDEAELRALLSAFEIRSLRLEDEIEKPGASRYFSVLAAAPAI